MAKRARLRVRLRHQRAKQANLLFYRRTGQFIFFNLIIFSGKAREPSAALPHTGQTAHHTHTHTYIRPHAHTSKTPRPKDRPGYTRIYTHTHTNAPSAKIDTMVGVPGKYKGCETCRRRRVKVCSLFPLNDFSRMNQT